MAELKSLAKDTAIYGASSIIGKFLNYFLVPIYTFSLPAASGGYGVITKMYAIVALLLVVLTFGMETGFFRFANKGDDDPKKVYSVSLLMVGGVSLIFLLLCLVFLNPIAGLMGYGEHPWYLGMMLIVLAMDAIQAIPFAYLRYKKRPIKFAGLKLLFIFVSILLNILYFVVMKGDDVVVASLTRLSSIRKNRSAGVSNRRHYFFISETDCFRYNLWNIQHIMDKPSLSRDHNGKCANSKEKYFSHSIDTAGLKLLFQIGRQDS